MSLLSRSCQRLNKLHHNDHRPECRYNPLFDDIPSLRPSPTLFYSVTSHLKLLPPLRDLHSRSCSPTRLSAFRPRPTVASIDRYRSSAPYSLPTSIPSPTWKDSLLSPRARTFPSSSPPKLASPPASLPAVCTGSGGIRRPRSCGRGRGSGKSRRDGWRGWGSLALVSMLLMYLLLLKRKPVLSQHYQRSQPQRLLARLPASPWNV